jgi:chromosome segregation ATPase
MVIEWAMYFALGFLSAGLVALLVMASVWRRAVRLTTRRIGAAIPPDVEAARTERDLDAARFARDVRRLELALADSRRRQAEERVAVGRGRAALDAVIGERDAAAASAAEGLAREAALADEIAERDRRIEEAQKTFGEAQMALATLEAQLGDEALERRRVERERDERALEALTRATENEALSLRLEAAEAELAARGERIEALAAAERRANAATAQEKDRADRLDRRIERLIADVADREETADRRQRELTRSREALVAAQERIAALTGSRDPRPLPVEPPSSATAAAPAGSEAERGRLAEDIARLTAEVVGLVAALDGGNGPIDRLLADAGRFPESGAAPSLADRIRAVRDDRRRAGATAAPQADEAV